MTRMATFIRRTVKVVGGQVSKLTLSLPAWIMLLQHDEDFDYLVCCVRITHQAIVRLFRSWGYSSFIGYRLDDFWLMVALTV